MSSSKNTLSIKKLGFVLPMLATALAMTSSAEAAITITISRIPTAPFERERALVSLSGSLTLAEYSGSDLSGGVLLPLLGDATNLDRLGENLNAGQPTTSPFILGQPTSDVNVGADADTALAVYSDTSAGNSTIAMFDVNNLGYVPTGVFALFAEFDPMASDFPNLEAGDILTLSGSFDIDLDDFYVASFVPGLHTGSYNGEAVTIDVVPVPEPSAIFLITLGSVALGFLRRR